MGFKGWLKSFKIVVCVNLIRSYITVRCTSQSLHDCMVANIAVRCTSQSIYDLHNYCDLAEPIKKR